MTAAKQDHGLVQLTRVIAIRHGETAWNVDTRIQGQLDIALNDTGRWQAQRLGEALAHEGIERIYSSDLARARETAQAVGDATGVAVHLDRSLRERAFGEFEGHTFAQIEERWPVESMRWRKREADFGPRGGESLQDFYARCVQAITRIAQAELGRTVAVVAHGGVLDCLYRAGARIPLQAPRTWQLANASINRLLYTPEGFSVVGWADGLHLERPETGEGAADAGPNGGDRVRHAA
jgi:probable phosphoglycerate mutase